MARMYAFYHAAKNYLSCSDFNADITVDVSETCENSLTVNFPNNCKEATQWAWDINGDGIADYAEDFQRFQTPAKRKDTAYPAGLYLCINSHQGKF